MEQNPSTRSCKILRRSIHHFLKNYHYFTTASLLLAFPFSAALLFSQSLLLPSSPLLFMTFHNHLISLFQAAGFPPSSQLFTILNHYISQTITSSILILPFTLSFLLISKASVIHFLSDQQQNPSFSSFLSIYNSILSTQICNSFLMLSANATCFSLLFIAFSCLEASGYSSTSCLLVLVLSAAAAILYSIILANTFVVCNLALVASGMDKSGGFLAIIPKACVLIRGRTATAVALAIPVNMALAAVEALFQYRVVRAFHTATSSTALEGILIAYMYSIIVVIDTIVNCEFFKSCKRGFRMDEEGGYAYGIPVEGQNGKAMDRAPLSSKVAHNFI
ncbi:hypothetical protein RHGRI_024093 [Rhododendron griersonianum]|uniref:Transmembrane protein n=1 Tax=Rhododendron griersonianum TaxID=479676 RepID=A0AAV6JBB7_9ERIC|nr:hypothetical protein RHGRI_024093 [Rhododendron griersonianum]